MKGHKRLGKGLEDVSHLFLSAEEEQESGPQDQTRPAAQLPRTPAQQFPMVVAVTGDHRSLEKSFLVSNLAIELAQQGRKVSVVDADPTFPDQSFLWGLRPPDSVVGLAAAEGDGQDLQVILRGPLGVQLLSLDIDFSRVVVLPEPARKRLLAGLMAFEANAQLMLVDTPAAIHINARLILQVAHQIVLLVPSDTLGMIDAYSVIKGILALRPAAPVGIVIYNVRMMAEAEAIARKMSQAVMKFLGFHTTVLGFLYADLNIAKSIAQRTPLVLSATRSKAAKCLRGIAYKIWAEKETRAQVAHTSFFAAMDQALGEGR